MLGSEGRGQEKGNALKAQSGCWRKTIVRGATGTGSICVDVPLICSLGAGCYERPAMRGSPARRELHNRAAGRPGESFKCDGSERSWGEEGAGGGDQLLLKLHPVTCTLLLLPGRNAAKQSADLTHRQIDRNNSRRPLEGEED